VAEAQVRRWCPRSSWPRPWSAVRPRARPPPPTARHRQHGAPCRENSCPAVGCSSARPRTRSERRPGDQSVATHEKLIGRKVDVQHNYHQWDTRQRGGRTDPDHPRRRCRRAVRAGFDRRWFGLAGYPRIRRRLRHLPGSGRSVVQLRRAGDGLEPGQGEAKADRLVCSSAATAVTLLRDNLRHIAVRADQGVLTVTVDG